MYKVEKKYAECKVYAVGHRPVKLGKAGQHLLGNLHGRGHPGIYYEPEKEEVQPKKTKKVD